MKRDNIGVNPQGFETGRLCPRRGVGGLGVPPQVAKNFNISTSMWCKMVQSGKEKVFFSKKLLNQHTGISC